MGVLANIFGSDKVIGKITDGIYNGVDKIVYTEEEKAENLKDVLKLYEPFKLAQRLLSLVFAIPFVICWTITFMMSFTDFDITEQAALLDGKMGDISLAIIGFYFFGGMLGGIPKDK